jgi:hypothetical protein
MKIGNKLAMWAAAFLVGAAVTGQAQTLMQPLSISLVAYDQPTQSRIRAVRITTRDVINLFAGTNVPNGRLFLVTQAGVPMSGVIVAGAPSVR